MASTVWKGHLTFGLISVPVKLQSAARSEALSFNMLRASDHSRVNQVLMIDDKPVPRSELVKGFEYEKDKYVVLSEAEIESAAPSTKRTVDVLEFVKGWEVNPVFLESSYFVAPNAARAEKQYALLFKALKASGYVGVAKITMHNREHVVIVGAGEHGLIMHTIYYADEVRQVEEFRTDCSSVKADELKMALRLIRSMRAKFAPEKFKDSYRENVMRVIAAKVNGDAIPTCGAIPHDAYSILTALKQSLNRNDSKSTAAAPAVSTRANDASHVSEKPHTNAHHTTRKRSRGMLRADGASSASERKSGGSGGSFCEQRGPGLRPPRPARSGLGTPKRSISHGKSRVLPG